MLALLQTWHLRANEHLNAGPAASLAPEGEEPVALGDFRAEHLVAGPAANLAPELRAPACFHRNLEEGESYSTNPLAPHTFLLEDLQRVSLHEAFYSPLLTLLAYGLCCSSKPATCLLTSAWINAALPEAEDGGEVYCLTICTLCTGSGSLLPSLGKSRNALSSI